MMGILNWLRSLFAPKKSATIIPIRPGVQSVVSNLTTLQIETINEASKYIGVHEVGGNNCGPEVEEFQKAVPGSKPEGQSWCMDFVQYVIKKVEAKFHVQANITRSEGCLDVWNQAPEETKVVGKIIPGDIIIWQHGDTDKGHTGFVKEVVRDKDGKALSLITIEGNTNDGSMREGDAVEIRHRSLDGEGSMIVKGYLRVFPTKPIEVS